MHPGQAGGPGGLLCVGCIPCEGSVGGSEGDKGQGGSGGQGRPHLRASAADPSWALHLTCTVRWGPLGSSLPSGKPAAEKYSCNPRSEHHSTAYHSVTWKKYRSLCNHYLYVCQSHLLPPRGNPLPLRRAFARPLARPGGHSATFRPPAFAC